MILTELKFQQNYFFNSLKIDFNWHSTVKKYLFKNNF